MTPTSSSERPRESLVPGYLRLIVAGVAFTGLAAILPAYPNRASEVYETTIWLLGLTAVGGVVFIAWRVAGGAVFRIEWWAERQSQLLDGVSNRSVPILIVAYSALGLFLELAVIRWHAGAVPILAFYKNFSLLAAFAGLGLGFALHARKHIPLHATIPLISFQLSAFWLLRRFSSAGFINPFAEQTAMGLREPVTVAETLGSYATLSAILLTTALAFIPIGQVTGRLMGRRANLRSYGSNLIGSICGVAMMFILSAYWVPAWLWFALAFVALIPLLAVSARGVVVTSLIAGVGVATIWFPTESGSEVVYSPYQILEYIESSQGDVILKSAGHYLLTASDLTPEATLGNERRTELAVYYEFPFLATDRLDDVLIVGAGAGNDVAAALRTGAARVDAVEIDPAITAFGADRHPEKPYEDARVKAITADARTHLANTTNSYDLIVYGLLDSHSVVSQGSNVRLDSFVYTVEGLTQARDRLRPGGMISLGFLAFTPELTEKIYLMLTEAFAGSPPIVLRSESSDNLVFVSSDGGNPTLPQSLLKRSDLVIVTDAISNSRLGTTVATDDWPFLYMARPAFPTSYVVMAALVLGAAYAMFRQLARGGFASGEIGFFFLGAGFLLIETKGITELGLAFGNTWEVVGIVIGAILVMAFLANVIVARSPRLRLGPVVVALLLSIAIGYVASLTGITTETGAGRWVALGLLTLPVFFSGLAFSLGLSVAAGVSGVLAVNLLGAIVGGLLEYTTLAIGYRPLYLLAAVVYAIGGVLLIRARSRMV